MVAVEFGEQRGVDGSYTAKPGCATAVTKAAQRRNMILLTAGKTECSLHALVTSQGIFLEQLRAHQIDEALEKLEGSLQEVFSNDKKTS